MDIKIALDAMGGDHGAHVTVPAAANFLAANPQAQIILVGQEPVLRAEMKSAGLSGDARVRVRHASEIVTMDEAIAAALRSKRDSSMRVAIDLVKSGDADACVSAGNTGALMGIARFVLKMLPGVERPAIASMLPTRRGRTLMLDLGANVDCSPLHLLQFGIMGSVLFGLVEQVDKPSVGLLNIGSEEIKGNELVKQASELLKGSGLNFYGNVEGDDIYRGTTDVVVCDGFVGNVLLKASEGVATMIVGFLRQEFTRTPWNMLAAWMAKPVRKALRARMDPGKYNGASLLGLKGIVIKSHGSADEYAFGQALERALEEVQNKVAERIASKMAQ